MTRVTEKFLQTKLANLGMPELRLSPGYGMYRIERVGPGSSVRDLSGYGSTGEINYWLNGFIEGLRYHEKRNKPIGN